MVAGGKNMVFPDFLTITFLNNFQMKSTFTSSKKMLDVLQNTTFILLFSLIGIHLHAQWQPFEPALPEPVGTFDLRIAPGNPDVAWTVCMKYGVTANGYSWQPMDSLVFTKTSDGGQTWQGGTIPMGTEPFGNSICPIDANTAWATGTDMDYTNYLLQTTDGGQTWARHLEDGFIGATSYVDFVHFFDAQHGIAMGDPAESATDPTPFFEIYATSDGGQNWTRIASDQIPAALPNEFGIDHLYDARGDTVWFGTVNATNFNSLRLFRSVDRGANWTVADSPAIWPFSFADGQYGIGAETVSSVQADLKLTTDGGDTWTDLPPLMLGKLTCLAMVPQSHFIVAVLRTNNIAGPFKTMLSTDLGQTWMEIGDGTQHAGNAQFASPTIGYAGEWQPADHPTRMYKYASDPLSGLLSGDPLDAEVSVFPNPASDFVSVNVKVAQPTDFLLLVNDAQGRLVERQVFQKTDLVAASIDLRGLPSGVIR